MQYEPILLGPQYCQKKSTPKTTLNTIRCNAMKSKRLILIILVHYKLDILVLVVWSILCYHVVFVRNLSFWRPNWDKNPNWDARVMSRSGKLLHMLS